MHLTDLLSGRATTPDAINTDVPIVERFAGKSLMVVMLGVDALIARKATVSSSGMVTFGSPRTNTTEQGPSQSDFLARLREEFDVTHVLVAVSYGMTCDLSHGLARLDDSSISRAIRHDPQRLLGTDFDDGKTTVISQHPSIDGNGVLFSYSSDLIPKVVDLAANANLTIAGIISSQWAILQHLGKSRVDFFGNTPLLIADISSSVVIDVVSKSWQTPTFDPNISHASYEAAVKAQFKDSRLVGKPIGVVCDLHPELFAALQNECGLQPESLLGEVGSWDAVIGNTGQDLRETLPEPRQHLPKRFRAGIAGYYVAMAAIIIMAAVLWFRAYKMTAEIEQTTSVATQATSEVHELLVSSNRMRDDTTRAAEIKQWIAISPDAQNIALLIIDSISQGVGLESLRFDLVAGQPQIRLQVSILGSREAAQQQMTKTRAALAAKGFELVSLGPPADITGGQRFDVTYNLPVL